MPLFRLARLEWEELRREHEGSYHTCQLNAIQDPGIAICMISSTSHGYALGTFEFDALCGSMSGLSENLNFQALGRTCSGFRPLW